MDRGAVIHHLSLLRQRNQVSCWYWNPGSIWCLPSIRPLQPPHGPLLPVHAAFVNPLHVALFLRCGTAGLEPLPPTHINPVSGVPARCNGLQTPKTRLPSPRLELQPPPYPRHSSYNTPAAAPTTPLPRPTHPPRLCAIINVKWVSICNPCQHSPPTTKMLPFLSSSSTRPSGLLRRTVYRAQPGGT